jgi:hypothetical protein
MKKNIMKKNIMNKKIYIHISNQKKIEQNSQNLMVKKRSKNGRKMVEKWVENKNVDEES